MRPPRSVDSELSGAWARRVRLAETIPAVRDGERAVLLRGDLDPVGRRMRRQRRPASATPAAAARTAAAGRSRQDGRNGCGLLDVRDEHPRAVLLEARSIRPVQLPDVFE